MNYQAEAIQAIEAQQDHYDKMSGYLAKVTSREPERAEKLHMAVKAVIERMAAG